MTVLSYWPFPTARLDELGRTDLDVLLAMPVDEGLFVEYKRDWPKNDVIGASICSFANSEGGGLLILGVATKAITPIELSGLEDGDTEDRVTAIARSSIAPIPSIIPKRIDVDGDRHCLVVVVPPGGQTPYIHIPSGRIYVRGPATSEPIRLQDRVTLDRLYARGRPGKRWARQQAAELSESFSGDPTIITVPEVEEGLSAATRIFQKSFVDGLVDRVVGPYGGRLRNHDVTTDGASVTFLGASLGEAITARVSTQGAVTTTWRGERTGKSALDLQLLSQSVGRCHREILEDLLHYMGSVTVTMLARDRGDRLTTIQFPSVDVGLLPIEEEAVKRAVLRATGTAIFEPD